MITKFLSADQRELCIYLYNFTFQIRLVSTKRVGNKVFRHVETLFVQGNQVRTDQNKSLFLLQVLCDELFHKFIHRRERSACECCCCVLTGTTVI